MKIGDCVRFKVEGSKLDNEIAKIVELTPDQKRVILEVFAPVHAAGFPEQNFRWETSALRVSVLGEDEALTVIQKQGTKL